MQPAFRFAIAALLAASLACTEEVVIGEWHAEDGYRWRELSVSDRGQAGFTLVGARRTGIAFTNSVPHEKILENRYLAHGGGVALGDVDADGWVDVFLAQADGPNKLYRNLGGWRFEDITERAGVAAPDRYSSGALFADVDGDADLDLVLAAFGGPNAVFFNDGTGVFVERSADAGLASTRASKTLTMADVEGDGDLDLYVTNYKLATPFDLYSPEQRAFDRVVREIDGVPEVIPEFRQHYEVGIIGGRPVRSERGEPDQLLLNDGNGRFEEVAFTGGTFLDEDGMPYDTVPHFFSLAARFYDIDQDGDPDLYVCNDFHHPDQFWINDGHGTFRAVPRVALRSTSVSTMAVDFGDLDRDGDIDFFEVDMLSRDSRLRKTQMMGHSPIPLPIGAIENRPQNAHNSLFVNRGDNTFTEISNYAGVDASEWSWGMLLLDVDLDGFEDALITNGHPWDVNDADTGERVVADASVPWNRQLDEFPSLATGNVAFRNNGDLTFTDVSEQWGFAPEEDVSHGIGSADLDGDGDLDVVVTRFEKPVSLFRNDATASRIAVRLRGAAPNTGAVGARISVSGGAVGRQVKEVTAGGMYLSGSDQLTTFATGTAEAVRIEITWPAGHLTAIDGARANRLYEITQPPGPAGPAEPAQPEPSPTWFEDLTPSLNHTHVEDPFDDHVRQPMILDRLSQLGPGTAWIDVDGDGDEDLLIGAGRTGRLAYYRNDSGVLRPVTLDMPVTDLDLAGIIGVPNGRGGSAVLVAQSTYESRSAADAFGAPAVLRVDIEAGSGGLRAAPRVTPATTADTSSVGPLAAADVDGDGDLDLFVGGRVIPAAYPVPATSRLYRNDGGVFVRDGSGFPSVGLVSSAVFSDVDADGDPDLVLAVEWGPLRLFLNEGGQYAEADSAWGLGAYLSRWNGVTTGDLDGDGRLDIIATSWGRNTTYRLNDHPVQAYFSDFDNNGTLDVFEAQYDERIQGIAPLIRYSRLRNTMPSLRQRLAGFGAYADSTLAGIVGRDLARINRRTINTLDHMVFFNRGGTFEGRPLPPEAQFAPAFHASVTDANGDGHDDVFLSQNFFATELAMPRLDGGRGLWLQGNGTGSLEAVPGHVTGVMVYGEQRGAAVADFDADGRVDLVVSQNGAATRLFRNRMATPGLRVRLQGPAGNPHGVGASLRLVQGEWQGPVREIHAGAGFWSQDGVVQVLGWGAVSQPAVVWVRWPGGNVTESPVASGTIEVTVTRAGEVVASR